VLKGREGKGEWGREGKRGKLGDSALVVGEIDAVVKLLKSRWWNATFPLPLSLLSPRSLSLPSPLLPAPRIP